MTEQIERAVEEQPFSTVFTYALQGHPCDVFGVGEEPEQVPVHAWTRSADEHDEAILDHCDGPTLDIGCGPGRMTAALADRGVVALGIDVVEEAVGQTVQRGGTALQRDVFDTLPDEGRWSFVLLVDGNVGIGGDPVPLLRRVRELLQPHGRVVVEVAPPGVPARASWASIQAAGVRSRPFRWAVVGLDDIGQVAAHAGLRVRETARHGERWCVVLEAAA